jgi:hypothetical protein
MTLTALEIPLTSGADDFTFRARLLDTYYRFRFTWNARDESWALSAFNDDETPIFTGRRMLLTSIHVLGAGALTVVANDYSDEQPGRNDLGGRVSLLWAYFE